MAYRVEQVVIPDSLAGEIGDGVYLLSFERGIFGGGSAQIEAWQRGATFYNGVTEFRVLDVQKPNEDTIYVKVQVTNAVIGVVGLVTVLLSAGLLAGLVGWSLIQVQKLFGLDSNDEICYDANGNPHPCSGGILQQLKELLGTTAFLLVIGSVAYFLWKRQRN